MIKKIQHILFFKSKELNMNVFSNSQELLNFIILKTFFFKVQRLGRSTPSSKLCSYSLDGHVFPLMHD